MSLEVLGMAALIFAARLAGLSLGTLRTAFIVLGKRALAFAFGFIEVFVCVVVGAQVIKNLGHPIYLFAFALGFASGTWSALRSRAGSPPAIRSFASSPPRGESLAAAMRERGFSATAFSGVGRDGVVHLLFISDSTTAKKRGYRSCANARSILLLHG
jgi:uncharacterized protein YebE (UPF0316 family)